MITFSSFPPSFALFIFRRAYSKCRLRSDELSKLWGQQVLVVNHPGAGGSLAARVASVAAPDGYTLYQPVSSTFVALHPAAPNVPLKVPRELNFASAGIGSASHMAGERLRLAAGINVQHIPYRGAEGLGEVMAGRIDYYFIPIAPAVPLIAEGKLVVLAVSTPNRAPSLPNVPTIAEAGYPDAEYLFWGGLSVPAKTPHYIIDKLHDETQKTLNMPTVQESLSKLGVQPRPMSIEQFDKFVRDDVAATVKLAKDAHIVPTN
jgi:tripartite-type tricarboxylate transporter receptor subunit TctC